MGCEDFQVMLKSREPTFIEVCDFLKSHTNIKLVKGSYFEYRDDNHLIEFEVRDTEVSLRFALCNPDTVDDVFVKLINYLSNRFSLDVVVMDDPGAAGLKDSILYKRGLWKKDFGDVVEALSCDQAIEKYVLS